MAGSASSLISVAARGSTGGEIDHTVVWLRGEHDIATKLSLVAAITGAVELDDADLFVDLSEVTFMDASTVGAIIASRILLRSRLLSLEVRAPSATARRLLDLCGLASLVRSSGTETVHPAGAGAALSTWVDVLPTHPVEHTVGEDVGEATCRAMTPRARFVGAVDGPGEGAAAEVEVDRDGP